MKPMTSKLARLVSLVVLMLLMSVFLNTVAHAYYDSLQCISGPSSQCQTTVETVSLKSTDTMTHSVATRNADPWLCSLGEAAYCAD